MLKQFGLSDFVDMYDELKFSPEDTWQRKYAAFQLVNLNDSIANQRRDHLVWVMNYLDCMGDELEIDAEFFAFLQARDPGLVFASEVAKVIRQNIQFTAFQ